VVAPALRAVFSLYLAAMAEAFVPLLLSLVVASMKS
jgi:hypothetical protein